MGEASADETAAGVAAALRRAGADVVALGEAGIVVVVGPVEQRAAAVRAAVAAGRHVFAAWPPGALAEAEALRRDAEEAGVEVGVERPLGAAIRAGDAPARLVGVTAVTDGTAWPRRLAGVLDVCAERAGSREAARLWAEAERDGARLLAVAVSVRFRNGALAQALVRAAAPGEAVAGVRVSVYAAGRAETADGADTLAAEAVAFVQAVAAARPAPYALDDALAALRLADRLAAALR